MDSWAHRIARHAVHTRAAIQDELELAALLELIREPPANVVVELGTQMGGTFYALSCAAAPDAIMISIDLDPLQGGGCTRNDLLTWCQPAQQIECIYADTHLPSTRDELMQILGDDQIDVLFIDADHHYAAVKQDHEWYSPFVRPGGWVVFHDIARTNQHQAGCEVGFYWREQIHHHPERVRHEFVNQASVFGIGAYQK